MALPLLALGKIVSGAVTATAKGLTVAGKATAKGSKVVGRSARKAARAGAELAYDVGSATKRGLIKGVKATTKELKKAASATKKSMSNFGKRMSNRKTGTEKLKRDANKKYNWNELKDKEYLVTLPTDKGTKNKKVHAKKIEKVQSF